MSHEQAISLPINSDINNTHTITESTANKWGGRAGIIITWAAMAMQGLLAFLLFNLFLKNLGNRALSSFVFELLNWGLGILILLFAIAGKAIIVNFYNDNTFKALAQSIENLVHSPREWFTAKYKALTALTWKDAALALPNAAMTLNISLVFGIGITHLSFINMSTLLLEDYSNPFIRTIAYYCSKLYVMAFFMACSVLCNLLGFPYIHMNSIGRIFQFINRIFENPAIRGWKADMICTIQTAALIWQHIFANQNKQHMSMFLNKLFNTESENPLSLDALDRNQVEEILKLPIDIKHLLSLRMLKNQRTEPVYWEEFLVTRSLGLTATALTIAGLYNFRQMGVDTVKLLQLSSPFIQNASGIAAFTSMSLMAIDAVMQPTSNLISNALFGRDYNYHSLSCRMRFTLGMLLFIGMLLGGFPNGYQEYAAGGSFATIAIALFSSAMVEVFAIYMLISTLLEMRNVNTLPFTQLANGMSKNIQAELDKLENASAKHVKELQAHIQPERAEEILNTSSDCESWRWIKKSTQSMSSCLTNFYKTHKRVPSQLTEQSPLIPTYRRNY